MTPETIALTLAAIHFGTPLLYYWYAKTRWLPKPWNIKTDPNYTPKITIIVPTYNEEKLIQKKLDNIHQQEYPRDKMEIIIIDSASTDKTIEKAKEWIKKHPQENIKIITEPKRRGKAHALNTALKQATGEIIITTDVDAWWPSPKTLKETTKWFKDPIVGAVSCLKKPTKSGVAGVETEYRQYYNTLRLAESKAWSTPIFHGELAAFRKKPLENLGGFPTHIGADDSHTATLIALIGYRAIIPESLTCIEAIPREKYHLWRIRRAQHLLQHFLKTLIMKPKTSSRFKLILYTEAFLHLVNPWIFLSATILLVISMLTRSLLATMLLIIGTLLLIYKPFRTWITTQFYLIIAMPRNIFNKEFVWKKINKYPT